MFLGVHGHTVAHQKALSSGKREPRGLSCSGTLNICRRLLKSVNLLYKRGFVKAQWLHTPLFKSNPNFFADEVQKCPQFLIPSAAPALCS